MAVRAHERDFELRRNLFGYSSGCIPAEEEFMPLLKELRNQGCRSRKNSLGAHVELNNRQMLLM